MEAAIASPAGNTPYGTIGELGEFGLISAIAARMPRPPGEAVGIGDDAAVLPVRGSRMVASTDLLVEGQHFRRDWSGPVDIGVKAAAQNLADLAAMGALPTALLVGLAAPADLPTAWALDFASGLAEEAGRAGAHVVGGDLSGAGTVVISVTALGAMAGLRPVTRGGARPSDVVAVAGRLGESAAGLALLQAGLADPLPASPGAPAGPGVPASPGVPVGPGAPAGRASHRGADLDAAVTAHRRPRPPYAAGREAAALGASSMIDISDGLLADLGHIAVASGVRIDVETARLAAGGPLIAAARALGLDPAARPGIPGPLSWILTGGEDHALAATFPAGNFIPTGWTAIGRVLEGRGLSVDGVNYPGDHGWRHFRRPVLSHF
jgi:thiamine-monophosphate kinase